MAEASTTPKQANTVPGHGDHDRVQMLSLKADGTPDQHNPEIIGDKDVAVAAAKAQFAEQAVSAKDVELRGATVDDGTVDANAKQDPTVSELQSAHEKAAKAAESAAEKVVNSLHKG